MTSLPFAMFEIFGQPEKLLAIVGGAAMGGLGSGWLVQMAVRGWTGQQVPRWILVTLRVVTAGLAGWLVALWLFSGGGGGPGGSGGFDFGSGNNSGNHKPTDHEPVNKVETEPRKDEDSTRNVTTLYVEVLGSQTVKELGGNHADLERCYRIKTPNGSQLMTLKEVETYIKQRAAADVKPALKGITIVLYRNSPARNVPKVSDLEEWASVMMVAGGNERLAVGYEEHHATDAPVQ